MSDVVQELTAPAPASDLSSLASRLEAGMSKLGISGDAEIRNPGSTNAVIVQNEAAVPAPAAAPVAEPAPTRDPETGRFLPKTEAPETVATPAAAPAAAAEAPTKDAVAAQAKLVKIYGMEVPVEEAEEVLTAYQEMARQELTTKEASLNQRLAEMEASIKQREALAEAREREIEDAVALARENPNAFLEAIQNGARVQNGKVETGMSPEAIRAQVRAEWEALQRENEAKQAAANLERSRTQNFESVVRDAFKSIDPDGRYGAAFKRNASDMLAVAMNEGKISPATPAAILKRQVFSVFKAAKDEFMSSIAGLTQKQAAVNQGAPPAVVGGGTPMPKQERPERRGPFDPNEFNSRMAARFNQLMQSGGGTL